MPSITETIRKTPGVCGGHACVRNSRIPVWTLYRLKEQGRSDEQLLADFPSLTAEALPAAWAYVGENQVEIQNAIGAQGQSVR